MSYVVREWLNLAVRWTHVFAAIMWVGQTYFFTWLDHAFHDEKQVWMVHSGGFYIVDKQKRPELLNQTLHWFKWEAFFIGHSAEMTYDILGRLATDTDAAGGSKTLVRSIVDNGYMVRINTTLSRKSTYEVDELVTGDERRITTFPDGTRTDLLVGTDGKRTTTWADGDCLYSYAGPRPTVFDADAATAKSQLDHRRIDTFARYRTHGHACGST